jgi:hypothetical protein
MLLTVEEALGELAAELPEPSPEARVAGAGGAAVVEEWEQVWIVGGATEEYGCREKFEFGPVDTVSVCLGVGVTLRHGGPQAAFGVVDSEIQRHPEGAGDSPS